MLAGEAQVVEEEEGARRRPEDSEEIAVSVGAAQVWFVGRGGRWSGELMKRGVTNYRWQVGPGRVGWPLANASRH